MSVSILRLNIAGQPVEWLTWQEAVCLYARDLHVWSLGDIAVSVHGGRCRATGKQTVIDLPAIMAFGGSHVARPRNVPSLTNAALFQRDGYLCLYCGNRFTRKELTRDHVVPSSKGGKDAWENVVAACKRCNHRKGNKLLQDTEMELIALPYRPNIAEYLALVNSQRILSDQLEFLRTQFSSNSRWL